MGAWTAGLCMSSPSNRQQQERLHVAEKTSIFLCLKIIHGMPSVKGWFPRGGILEIEVENISRFVA
jgi:hypothetical protein